MFDQGLSHIGAAPEFGYLSQSSFHCISIRQIQAYKRKVCSMSTLAHTTDLSFIILDFLCPSVHQVEDSRPDKDDDHG